MRYRLLLLDWDGTVRDSIGSIVGCAREALSTVGLEADEAVVRGTVGLSIQDSIALWAPGAGRKALVRIQEAYRDRWIAHWHARAELFPGVDRALVELHGRGHWLAVATGKSRVGLDRDFGTLSEELRALFVASRTADETASKPSPAMVHALLDELGATLEEALVVGDSAHDLQMARNAGCDAVAVLGGAADEEELRRHHPLEVIGSLAELPRWLRPG